MNSEIYSGRKGFSVLGVILIILLLAGLGLGGYIGYTQYLAPMMNPYAKLLPEGLKEYVKGANADAFVVYKKDAELEEHLKKLPTELLAANAVQSAVVLVHRASESIVIYVEFGSENEANMAKGYLEQQTKALADSNPSQKIDLQIKGNVLIALMGDGEQAFNGPLTANPNIGRIDKQRLNDQLIFYVNIANFDDFNDLIPGDISTAPLAGDEFNLADSSGVTPDGISRLLKDGIVYLRLKEGILSSLLTFNILTKEELRSSEMLKEYIENDTQEDLEKQYDQAMDQFGKSVPDMNRGAGFVKMFVPSLDIKIALEGMVFSVDIQSPLQDLVDLAVKQDLIGSMTEGPSKAHDAAKKAAINNIITAVEQYNAANGNYPEKSLCVDEMVELSGYFRDGVIPADQKGAQKFGDLDCPGGYYYQWIPGRGYVVWAKMVLGKDGNMELTPDQYLANLQQNLITSKVSAGQFYAWGDGLILDEQPNITSDETVVDEIVPTQAVKVKVKR